MIFVDSNIFMYAAGKPHQNKKPSLQFLRKVAEAELQAFISVEILQEILHRYRSINRWEDGKQVYDAVLKIIPQIEPVSVDIIKKGYQFLNKYPDIMARDALHAATCSLLKAKAICSYDRDFDAIKEIQRHEPEYFLDNC